MKAAEAVRRGALAVVWGLAAGSSWAQTAAQVGLPLPVEVLRAAVQAQPRVAAAEAAVADADAQVATARATFAVQPQGVIYSGPAQARLLNDLHHANSLAVHAYNLLATFVQYFSRLLAGIFFLHELVDCISLHKFIYKSCRVYRIKPCLICC